MEISYVLGATVSILVVALAFVMWTLAHSRHGHERTFRVGWWLEWSDAAASKPGDEAEELSHRTASTAEPPGDSSP